MRKRLDQLGFLGIPYLTDWIYRRNLMRNIFCVYIFSSLETLGFPFLVRIDFGSDFCWSLQHASQVLCLQNILVVDHQAHWINTTRQRKRENVSGIDSKERT